MYFCYSFKWISLKSLFAPTFKNIAAYFSPRWGCPRVMSPSPSIILRYKPIFLSAGLASPFYFIFFVKENLKVNVWCLHIWSICLSITKFYCECDISKYFQLQSQRIGKEHISCIKGDAFYLDFQCEKNTFKQTSKIDVMDYKLFVSLFFMATPFGYSLGKSWTLDMNLTLYFSKQLGTPAKLQILQQLSRRNL